MRCILAAVQVQTDPPLNKNEKADYRATASKRRRPLTSSSLQGEAAAASSGLI